MEKIVRNIEVNCQEYWHEICTSIKEKSDCITRDIIQRYESLGNLGNDLEQLGERLERDYEITEKNIYLFLKGRILFKEVISKLISLVCFSLSETGVTFEVIQHNVNHKLKDNCIYYSYNYRPLEKIKKDIEEYFRTFFTT